MNKIKVAFRSQLELFPGSTLTPDPFPRNREAKKSTSQAPTKHPHRETEPAWRRRAADQARRRVCSAAASKGSAGGRSVEEVIGNGTALDAKAEDARGGERSGLEGPAGGESAARRERRGIGW